MTNEPAERLLFLASNRQVPDGNLMDLSVGEFRAALAAERRATVERIRAALEQHDPDQAGYRIWAILDAEAQR